MKNLKETFLTLSLLSCSLFIWGQSKIVSAINKQNTASTAFACGDLFQVTDEASMYVDIDIRGDYLAWGDIHGNINLYQISKDELTSVYVGSIDDLNASVYLDDTYLYYKTEINFGEYHLESGTITQLYGDLYASAFINANHLVRVELLGNNNLEVFYSDLNTTNAPVNISNNPDTDRYVFVGEETIAWISSDNAEERLMVYSPADGTNQGEVVATTMNTSGLDFYQPITIGKAVYFSKKNGNFNQLWSYNTETEMTNLVLDLQSDHYVNAVRGETLVLRNNASVVLYDITTGTQTNIPNSSNNGRTVINDRYVFWEREVGGLNRDILRYDRNSNQTTTYANTMDSDFLIYISDEYAVHAQGDMVSDHLLISSLIPLAIENVVIKHEMNPGGNGSIELDVVGSIGGLTYAWSGPNGFTSEEEDLSNLTLGTYNLVVTDGNGCTASYTAIIDAVANVETSLVAEGGRLYPNPATEVLHLEWGANVAPIGQIEIFDVYGRRTFGTSAAASSGETFRIPIADWQPGVYFVRLQRGQKFVQQSFVKK